jgi:rod shape-determining protein MreC
MSRVNDALLFKKNTATDLRYFFLILIAMIMMVADFRYDYLTLIRNGFSLAVTPIQYAVNYPTDLYRGISRNLKSYQTLQQENQNLRQQQYVLTAKLQQFQSLQQENHRLRALLKSSPKTDEEMTIASLLAVAMDPFQQILTLAKGKLQGVQLGQPVLDDNGVIGQIMRVKPSSSEVLLVTDTRSAVPVVNSRNGIRSIAIGTNSIDAMKLLHISNTADLKVGDLFVTSGMGQRFPEGYPVGIVESVTQQPGESFAEVLMKPAAKIDRTRFVLLVKSRKQTS